MELYNNAIEIDSNFVSAMMNQAFCYGALRQARMSRYWAYKAYERIDQLPHDMQLMVKEVKAAVDKKPLEQIKQMKQYKLCNFLSVKSLNHGYSLFFDVRQLISRSALLLMSCLLVFKFPKPLHIEVFTAGDPVLMPFLQ